MKSLSYSQIALLLLCLVAIWASIVSVLERNDRDSVPDSSQISDAKLLRFNMRIMKFRWKHNRLPTDLEFRDQVGPESDAREAGVKYCLVNLKNGTLVALLFDCKGMEDGCRSQGISDNSSFSVLFSKRDAETIVKYPDGEIARDEVDFLTKLFKSSNSEQPEDRGAK